MSESKFSGKRVMITGSSRGIGFSTAQLFLDMGARVAINGSTCASTRSAIERLGSCNVVSAAGNVSEVSGCKSAVSSAIEQLGGLDVLVNSAGVADYTPLENVTEEIWDSVIDTNLKGTFFCISEAITSLKESSGVIVNVASDAGLIGERNLSVYCASKGGVVNLTRALAIELAPHVRVNCVCPGYTDTDMVRRDVIEKAENPRGTEALIRAYSPMKRITTPEDVASLIAFLCGESASTITGSTFSIDGGSTAGRGA